jgi:hypothetical protein
LSINEVADLIHEDVVLIHEEFLLIHEKVLLIVVVTGLMFDQGFAAGDVTDSIDGFSSSSVSS